MKPCFNTSHVTLYQMHSWTATICFDVSIHHMLLFIASAEPVLSPTIMVSIHHMLLFIRRWRRWGFASTWFQYITCYSLSRHGWSWNPYPGVSIHHMLLFIPRFIGILSIHMSNNTPKPKEFQYFYQALLEILYF